MGLTRIRADQIADIDYKQAVRVITLSNVTLSLGAPAQVDGVNLNQGDRVLVAGQSTATQNGIYQVDAAGTGSNGTWVRANDANTTGEIQAGMIVMVTEGTVWADTSWKLITNDPIAIGGTALIFTQNTGDSFSTMIANGVSIQANAVSSAVTYTPGNNFVITGNATTDTVTFAVADAPVFTGNVSAGNISTTGNIGGGNLSASGNVTATYYHGDGSYLTGIVPVLQSYLFANVASNISPYLQAVPINQFTIGTLAIATTTVGTTATLIGEFITNLGYPNATSIPAGQITGRYETTKGNGAKLYTTYFTLVKRNLAGTETVISTSDITTPTAVNTLVQQVTTALNTSSVALLTTDRLAVKIYAYTATGTDSITLGWDDNTDSGFDLPTSPPSIADFVPYQNATANVDLGTYSLSTSGNITSNYFIGNGSQLTGLAATYANANAAAYGEAGWAGNIIPAANVTYTLGNATNQWKSVYVGANTLYINNVAVSVNSSNVLTVAGANVTTQNANGNITSGNAAITGTTAATSKTTGALTVAGGVGVASDVWAGNSITVDGGAYGNVVTTQFAGVFATASGPNPYSIVQVRSNDGTTGLGMQAYTGLNGLIYSNSGVTFQTGATIRDKDYPTGGTTRATIDSTGLSVTGIANISGNITGSNILTAGFISATGNITGGNIVSGAGTGGSITGANIISGNTFNAVTVSASGNITGVNILTAGIVSATGNVSGNYILGNGSQLTGIAASYGNDNVATFLAAFGSNTVSTTGNITTGNLLTGGFISATGNITGGNIVSGAGTGGSITGANIISGNTFNAVTVSATGNITGSFIIGNGSQLTGLPAGYSNSNLATLGSNVISTTGTITGGNITGSNILTSGFISATGNITGGNIVSGAGTGGSITGANVIAGNTFNAVTVSASGNITGSNLTVGNIINSNANGVGNIGSSSTYFDTVFAKATSAQYADLAEMYCADIKYPPGTVVEFGGIEEVTQTTTTHSTAVAGIVSTHPSYLMNSTLDCATAVEVALVGRVPCRVVGTIAKGDRLVSSNLPGVATALAAEEYQPGCIVGKALEAYDSAEAGTIEVAVGRT